jgi:hypothetical protein
MEECDNTFRIPSQYFFFNIEELKHHTEIHHLDPLLNESNPDLLESLYDDDDNVRTMTTTTKQFAHDPIEGTCSYMNIFLVLLFGVKTPLQFTINRFQFQGQG